MRSFDPDGRDPAPRSRSRRTSISSFSTCRAPGSPGPTTCCSAPTGSSSSARRRCRVCATRKQLVEAVRERLGDSPSHRSSSIASSRSCFHQGCASPTSSRRLADRLVACVPNDYGLVREAIDRGVPLKKSSRATRSRRSSRSSLSASHGKAAEEAVVRKKFKLSWARSGSIRPTIGHSRCSRENGSLQRKQELPFASAASGKLIRAPPRCRGYPYGSRFSTRRIAAPNSLPVADDTAPEDVSRTDSPKPPLSPSPASRSAIRC